LHLRITPKGQRSFVHQATRTGIRVYEPIGNADHMSVDEARKIAKRKRNAHAHAVSPEKVCPDQG
tara:strand:+ start:1323 stop:1517 length:195 start_codon:yes stop_codon:yes gene_type:complete